MRILPFLLLSVSVIVGCSNTADVKSTATTQNSAQTNRQSAQIDKLVREQHVLNQRLTTLDEVDMRLAQLEAEKFDKASFDELFELINAQLSALNTDKASNDSIEALRDAVLERFDALQAAIDSASETAAVAQTSVAAIEAKTNEIHTRIDVLAQNTADDIAVLKASFDTDAMADNVAAAHKAIADLQAAAADKEQLIDVAGTVVSLQQQITEIDNYGKELGANVQFVVQSLTQVSESIQVIQALVTEKTSAAISETELETAIEELRDELVSVEAMSEAVAAIRDQLLGIADQLVILDDAKANKEYVEANNVVLERRTNAQMSAIRDNMVLQNDIETLRSMVVERFEGLRNDFADSDTLRSVHIELLEGLDWLDRQYRSNAKAIEALRARIDRLSAGAVQ